MDEKWLLSMKYYTKFRYEISICDYKNVRLCLQTHWKARIIPQFGIGVCTQAHCFPVSYSFWIIIIFYDSVYRNQSYHTRIQLAVLDHNAHLHRQIAENKKGEPMHSRKFRKQTKKWDTTPTLTMKKYEYTYPKYNG